MYYMYYRPAMLRATLSKVQLNEGKSNVTIISCKEPQQWETMRALRRRCAAHYASPLVSTTGNCTNQSLPLSPSSISLRIKFDKIPKLDKKKMDHLSKCKIARKKEIVSLKKKKEKNDDSTIELTPKNHHYYLYTPWSSPFFHFFSFFNFTRFITSFTGNEQSWLSIARASYALRFKSGLTTV